MTTIPGTSPLGEPVLDRLAVTWRTWTARHPRAIRGASLLLRSCSWGAAAGALAAAAFLPASRAALLALLWSQYALFQVYLLARSKSLTWQTCGRFFALGALVSAPAAALFTGLLTALFGAQPDGLGSAAGLAPLLEEGLKLMPLLLFVAGTSRARSLGAADLGLVGAALGAGFACTEEVARRVVALGGGASVAATGAGLGADPGLAASSWRVLALLPGQAGGPGAGLAASSWRALALLPGQPGGPGAGLEAPSWRVLALLPGQAGGPGRSFAGHVVLTAVVGLGVGLALRYRRVPGRAPLLLPGGLFVLAVTDHAAWNGQTGLPRALLGVHDALGAGGVAAPLLLALLAAATLVDYRDLNRRRRWLVLLPGEHRLDPLGELRLLVRLAPSGLPGTANLLSFLRRRRRLGYGLAQPDRHRDEALGALAARVAGHGRQLSSLLDPADRPGADAGRGDRGPRHSDAAAAVMALAGVLAAAGGPGRLGRAVAPGPGSVAVWFDRVGPWWAALPWAGRAAAAGTVATLTGLAVGGWTAGLGVALVARDAADRRADLLRFRKDPGYTTLRWMETVTPAQLLAYATSTLVDLLLRRVPADDDARRRARRWPDGLLPGGVDVEALFHGRLDASDPFRPQPLGFAHRGSIGAAPHARIAEGSASAPDGAGAYAAVVEVRAGPGEGWVSADTPTGFFPDAWSRARVLAEVRGALEEAVVEGGRWTGTSPSGLRLEGRVDPDGTVRTAHPIPAPRAARTAA